ncbi:hypothetical protein [Streptomyces monashensis]|uniref:Uncharacterized protein n=1 Tax=Streptomyces monashensis TaxID=1678012 RepID=A0A1S2QKE3_9ACTN|nr:hypothetical protein [Streptomyces monashensis]OIK06649.1 hypothetical protein BIV23_06555 [Streptomyces monashensis]
MPSARPACSHSASNLKARLFDIYARRSALAEATPDAVDVSDSDLGRLIVEEEQIRLGLANGGRGAEEATGANGGVGSSAEEFHATGADDDLAGAAPSPCHARTRERSRRVRSDGS